MRIRRGVISTRQRVRKAGGGYAHRPTPIGAIGVSDKSNETQKCWSEAFLSYDLL